MNEPFIYAYLRASTKEQDAERAKQVLSEFTQSHGKRIAAFFIENVSGIQLERPELNKLVEQAQCNDILLIEAVDRLSRLPFQQWEQLKHKLNDKRIKIVALDVPTSHSLLNPSNELSQPIISAMNNMLIDILAALAHQDYLTRRQRQRQGIEKAKSVGKYKGRPANKKMHARIIKMLENGFSYSEIKETLGVSTGTISRIKNIYRL